MVQRHPNLRLIEWAVEVVSDDERFHLAVVAVKKASAINPRVYAGPFQQVQVVLRQLVDCRWGLGFVEEFHLQKHLTRICRLSTSSQLRYHGLLKRDGVLRTDVLTLGLLVDGQEESTQMPLRPFQSLPLTGTMIFSAFHRPISNGVGTTN